ncbi:DUF4229 domain-containing protein [Corynebacterium sp.]|uniref:DUF4229 domain-containing protein n=1 Tax=Corynebacterium sp. TaxID=1720 RepID=UPI0026DAC899|nr:DUF4229 domain-containing protein [Corynebacterium sp.]MDO4609927.1 DUF4229 domain-containing protein [Corynebacterium sp.]
MNEEKQEAAAAVRSVERPTGSDVSSSRGRAAKDVAIYGLARLALFVVILLVLVGVVVLLHVHMPMAILAVLALIIALPASMLLFTPLRVRANEGVAEWDANRRAHRDYVRGRLAEREV